MNERVYGIDKEDGVATICEAEHKDGVMIVHDIIQLPIKDKDCWEGAKE